MSEVHRPWFEDVEQQAHAARLGMWIFLASELLLFAGLFTLYGTYRIAYPEAFAKGAGETDLWLMSAGTVVLLTGSVLVALAVDFSRKGARGSTTALLSAGALTGAGFLAMKLVEWHHHVTKGVLPGGGPGVEDVAGLQIFWALYYVTTGLHAVHVAVGVLVLAGVTVLVALGRVPPHRSHLVENGGAYWHLVDVIWLFVWPMFYLMR